MAKIKCTECGQVFDQSLTFCPKCGCPASECETVETSDESRATARELGNGVIHDSYNEDVPYSPFSPSSWFFKDPAWLQKYPKGALDVKHPFIGYLLAPWYLTCKNENTHESYNVINNLFYFFNLLFKTYVYANVWTFLKGLKIILLLLGIILIYAILLTAIFEIHDSGLRTPLSIIVSVLFFVACAGCVITLVVINICGIGKALHRYWNNIYGTYMRLNKRYWIHIHKAIKNDTIE